MLHDEFLHVTGAILKGRLGPAELICQYIRHEQIEEAINILVGMNWNTAGLQCYTCLIAIVDHLLKQKLTPERECENAWNNHL